MAKSFVEVVKQRLNTEREALVFFMKECKGSHHANMAENLEACTKRVEYLGRLFTKVAHRASKRP